MNYAALALATAMIGLFANAVTYAATGRLGVAAMWLCAMPVTWVLRRWVIY